MGDLLGIDLRVAVSDTRDCRATVVVRRNPTKGLAVRWHLLLRPSSSALFCRIIAEQRSEIQQTCCLGPIVLKCAFFGSRMHSCPLSRFQRGCRSVKLLADRWDTAFSGFPHHCNTSAKVCIFMRHSSIGALSIRYGSMVVSGALCAMLCPARFLSCLPLLAHRLQSTRAASAPPARCAPCTRPGGLGGAVAASFRAMGGKPTFRLPTVLAAAAPKKKKASGM